MCAARAASQICEGDKYPTIGDALTTVSMCISSMRPTTDIILSFQASIFNGLMEPCVRAARAAIFRDLEQRWTEDIDYNVRMILCIRSMLDPHFKTIKDTAPEFTENILDMDSVLEFELLVRWVPKEPGADCSVIKDASTVTATNSSLTPSDSRVSGALTLQFCTAKTISVSSPYLLMLLFTGPILSLTRVVIVSEFQNCCPY